MRSRVAGSIFLSVALLISAAAFLPAADTTDTVFLSQPAISAGAIAFVYAGDLWTAAPDGTDPRRLTTGLGLEFNPFFSPDGRWIAFSAQYDGNTDVYLMPAGGGVPKRLTWHPYPDLVQGFSVDGKAVIFTSARNSFTGGWNNLFSIPLEGGFPQQFELPYVYRATFSPDGKRIAYNPLPDAFTQWKNYRGGRVSTISLYDLGDRSLEKLPQPEGRANDAGPMWMGEKVYFRSDRNGEFNLFAYDTKNGKLEELTHHDDFPVLNASCGAGKIIYEQAGRLHVYDPATGKTNDLAIKIAADLLELRERYVKGLKYVRNAALSPTGARAVFEFRGEIVTVPAEKGDFRNITLTPGANERSPIWSPDGKSIAYFSDESGEYELVVRGQDGRGEARKYKLDGAGFYESPVWSPDGKKISYGDNSMGLFWINLGTGVTKKVASEYLYRPAGGRNVYSSWSPDSKWLAYTIGTKTSIMRVFVYSLEKGLSYPITDGMSESCEPVFDKSGKYLFFYASTDAGPVKQWFDLSNSGLVMTSSFYMAVLGKDTADPLARESDEEKAVAEEKAAPAAGKPDKPGKAGKAPEEKKVEATVIDLEGLDHRIVALPLPEGNYGEVQPGASGQLFYVEYPPAVGSGKGGAKLHKFDLKTRKDEVVLEPLDGYIISADGKKILCLGGGAWSIVPTEGKVQAGKGRLNMDEIEVRIDPRAEWTQIFNEAWRINRDYFYDPNMHGCDWKAMREKYSAFIPSLACRADLNSLIQWMCSELAVGHHRVGGGDIAVEPKRVPGGLLGADYEVANGRYRFKKVYGGLNWNPEMRSPLTEPGVDIKAGEYLLAVEGHELKPPMNLYGVFENTADKIMEITVGPDPSGKGSRTVKVVPIGSEYQLRNRDWVEGNLKRVEEATGGRVAYVYVPNTSTAGYTYFKRYFYPQADRDAIIVDERHNGGGQLADYYIDHLRKPFVSMWAMRYGADLKSPSAYIPGPKVMLIDETAGSGGDLLPWMFRKFGLGPLIGKRTWGGLVGILGFPVLMDGGFVTAPNLAIWSEDGWVVENEGVPPDTEVDMAPADCLNGRDPQLEKAIETVMEMLRKDPPKKLQRPPFPVRVRK